MDRKTVGGTTVHWTAATPRDREWKSRRAPATETCCTSLIDWPIPYAELKNYYQLGRTNAMGVTRRNGVPGMPASNNFK